MVTNRELITTVLEGGTPERTPYTIYEWFFGDVRHPYEAWKPLIEQGLGISASVNTVRHVEHGVKDTIDTRIEGDLLVITLRKETPMGTLQQVIVYPADPQAGLMVGWKREEWIKEPNDYKIRQWIIENTELIPQYEAFEACEARIGDQGITLVDGSRTPAMSICVDWAGTERFCMDIALEMDELMELYESQKKLFLEETRLIAAGPGRYVRWLENLTISTLGPRRYEKLLLPIYEEASPILQNVGKRLMVHYDGALRVIASQIARSPIQIIESLTEPPEGDLTFDEGRQFWPNKMFWGNLNVGLYKLPPDRLAEEVIAKRERAGKRAFAFEISEDVPENWRESVPVVLKTLAELR